MSKKPMQTTSQNSPHSSVSSRPGNARVYGFTLVKSPIAQRLLLSFLIAAILSASIVVITGIQRTRSMETQKTFYHNVLQTNTTLTQGGSFLHLMNTKLNQTLNAASQFNTAPETFSQDLQDIQQLAQNYDSILNEYSEKYLIEKRPERDVLLAEDDSKLLITKQHTLVNSSARTWSAYQDVQNNILTSIDENNVSEAQRLNSTLAITAHADAVSALNTLIQLDKELVNALLVAGSIEEGTQLILTFIGAFAVFLLVGSIGWFMAGTMVSRLRDLRGVVQAVNNGRLDTRAIVSGKDEIAQVAVAFNTMLDTIIGLLEDAQRQRDALSRATDNLISSVRVAEGGDLRVNAPVSNDPVGMLANAFNFTIGRFRRLVLRTHTALKQLEVISNQEYAHTEKFIMVTKNIIASHNIVSVEKVEGSLSPSQLLHHAQSPARAISWSHIEPRIRTILTQIEHTDKICMQIVARPIPEAQAFRMQWSGLKMEMQRLQLDIAKEVYGANDADSGENVRYQNMAQEGMFQNPNKLQSNEQEIAHLSLNFANDISKSIIRTRNILQEMYAALSAFQVEIKEHSS